MHGPFPDGTSACALPSEGLTPSVDGAAHHIRQAFPYNIREYILIFLTTTGDYPLYRPTNNPYQPGGSGIRNQEGSP